MLELLLGINDLMHQKDKFIDHQNMKAEEARKKISHNRVVRQEVQTRSLDNHLNIIIQLAAEKSTWTLNKELNKLFFDDDAVDTVGGMYESLSSDNKGQKKDDDECEANGSTVISDAIKSSGRLKNRMIDKLERILDKAAVANNMKKITISDGNGSHTGYRYVWSDGELEIAGESFIRVLFHGADATIASCEALDWANDVFMKIEKLKIKVAQDQVKKKEKREPSKGAKSA